MIVAQELLHALEEQGIAVRPDGEGLRIRPKSRLTPELREQLIANKPELIDLLRSEWPPECLDAEERFGQPHMRLAPLILHRVSTPEGGGVLLQVTSRAAAVRLDNRKEVGILPWDVIRPQGPP